MKEDRQRERERLQATDVYTLFYPLLYYLLFPSLVMPFIESFQRSL